MSESVLYIFKWPNTLTMLSHFWNEYSERFQAQVDYTLTPCPKINPNRIQRRINVDRVSFDVCVARIRQYLPSPTAESQDMWGLGSSAHAKANSYGRCFPELRPQPKAEESGYLKLARSQEYNGSRPDRTALRKTPRGWLPSNVITKDHAGFVSMDSRLKVRPLS